MKNLWNDNGVQEAGIPKVLAKFWNTEKFCHSFQKT